MVIEFIDEPKKPVSDLVNEARELFASYQRGNRSVDMTTRSFILLYALAAELDQQTSRIATQAESLSTCHARMKLQKDAIESAIKWFQWWIEEPETDYPKGLPDSPMILFKLRQAITPKGETK